MLHWQANALQRLPERLMECTSLLVLILLSQFVFAEEILVWQDCVREAKENHPDLISAAEKINQAKANKDIVKSNLFPQIGANLDASTENRSSQNNISDSVNGSRNSYSYGIAGQQLIFDGLKTPYNVSSAQENIISSRYNYDVISSNIRLRLRTAFVNLLNAHEYLKVTEDIANRRKQNLDLVRLRYEGGREHRGSLLTSEADLAEALFFVSQARRNIELSQIRLIKELGRAKKETQIIAKGDFIVLCKERNKPDFVIFAETNPFLQQLIAQKEAAKYGVKSAYAEFFPQIYANGNAGRSDSSWPPNQDEWSIGISASLPIFEGGLRVADVSKAKAFLGQTQADERSGRDGVIFTLADTWTKLQNAIDNIEVQEKYLEATEERARISEAEYSNGLISFDNWIIIEDNLVSAKKKHLEAQTNALLAEANWIQAKGGTLAYDTE